MLDVLTGLAEAATINRYHQPTVHEGGTIQITEGRHPVIEQIQNAEGFIPNDTTLDLDTNRLLLITGPNMAGKSTYLRQVALIVLMAQMGSFVPADSARIGIVDRIFTRVGAADDLSAGQSTFMVEMSETARILDTATSRSLLLLDEVGRGTSTYDGLSIAWALAEYILDRGHLGARTLFATHYHEMTQLETLREGIKNYTVLVQEKGQDVLFLRKIIQGKADRSYGIQVAKLAGIPKPVLDRAKNILFQLEQDTSSTNVSLSDEPVNPLTEHSSPKPHVILEEVKQMDLFSMTPLEALNRLADFKARLNENDA
jgi:DNA mismatch repair protein MutS